MYKPKGNVSFIAYSFFSMAATGAPLQPITAQGSSLAVCQKQRSSLHLGQQLCAVSRGKGAGEKAVRNQELANPYKTSVPAYSGTEYRNPPRTAKAAMRRLLPAAGDFTSRLSARLRRAGTRRITPRIYIIADHDRIVKCRSLSRSRFPGE